MGAVVEDVAEGAVDDETGLEALGLDLDPFRLAPGPPGQLNHRCSQLICPATDMVTKCGLNISAKTHRLSQNIADFDSDFEPKNLFYVKVRHPDPGKYRDFLTT